MCATSPTNVWPDAHPSRRYVGGLEEIGLSMAINDMLLLSTGATGTGFLNRSNAVIRLFPVWRRATGAGSAAFHGLRVKGAFEVKPGRNRPTRNKTLHSLTHARTHSLTHSRTHARTLTPNPTGKRHLRQRSRQSFGCGREVGRRSVVRHTQPVGPRERTRDGARGRACNRRRDRSALGYR